MYNFTVEDWHNYFVSDSSVLVHNANCGGDAIGNEDIYAFGNASGPRGGRPVDFGVESFEDIINPNNYVGGASNFNNKGLDNANLTGSYYKLEAGTILPKELGVVFDGKDRGGKNGIGHCSIYPKIAMTVNEFNEIYKSMGWKFEGKRRK